MSRISKAVKVQRENNILRTNETHKNFMGGESYSINPLDTLKMVACSSIFGEPQYYRKNVCDSKLYSVDGDFSDDFYKGFHDGFDGLSVSQVFEKAIDDSLSYDFESTLNFAVTLRTLYNMRLNPQIIMVRAAIHPNRISFTESNRGKFNEINQKVMFRADDALAQLTYFMYINGGKKNNIPSVLKRSIASKLSNLNAYQVNKYKNHEIGMINAVRVTHANSEVLNTLMKTGSVDVTESETTWEQKRSSGMSWKDILETTKLGHMAMRRNLVNIFTEIDDIEFCKKFLEDFKNGVINGKQLPFEYYSAYRQVQKSNCNHMSLILDALEECIDISIEHMPKLTGKTMCLSDNSGSAWGAFTSQYGSVTVAEIDNLSSVIAARCSDEGYVGKFGDKIIVYPVSKRNGTLKQAQEITANRGNDVGPSTEGGIWEFFRDAIKNKTHFDNIFIFSDQQAGTGGLYGTDFHLRQYSREYGCKGYSRHINVFKLILEYRKQVNPKVNVFSVQTAGYTDVLIPDMSYRTAMLTGWTGKEVLFANSYIEQWDSIENR